MKIWPGRYHQIPRNVRLGQFSLLTVLHRKRNMKGKIIYVLWAIKSSTANWMTIRLRVIFCERVRSTVFEKGEKVVAVAANSNVFSRNRGALHVFKGRRCSLFFALLLYLCFPSDCCKVIQFAKEKEGGVICNKWCNSNLPIFQFWNIISFSQLYIFQHIHIFLAIG